MKKMIEIDIPEGMEYDCVSTIAINMSTKDKLYALRFKPKKPETLWFRAYRYKSVTTGFVEIGTYSTVKTESDKMACEREAESTTGFIAWITPWTEYEI